MSKESEYTKQVDILYKALSLSMNDTPVTVCIEALLNNVVNVASQADLELQEDIIRLVAEVAHRMTDDLHEERKLMAKSH